MKWIGIGAIIYTVVFVAAALWAASRIAAG